MILLIFFIIMKSDKFLNLFFFKYILITIRKNASNNCIFSFHVKAASHLLKELIKNSEIFCFKTKCLILKINFNIWK